jgi:hypothetical protein
MYFIQYFEIDTKLIRGIFCDQSFVLVKKLPNSIYFYCINHYIIG